MKVGERLLLDRIDAQPRRAIVGGQHHLAALVLPDEAQAALTLGERAVARAQITDDPAVVAGVPVAGRVGQ